MYDHKKKVLSRIYWQYRDSPKLIKWLLILPDIAQSKIEEQLEKIKRMLDVDKAEGEQLDICGRIAGYAKRPSGKFHPMCVYVEVTDDIFRRLIKSKIFKNNSIATIDEIKQAADYILDIETTVLDSQDMTMRLVWFEDTVDVATQQLVRDYDLIPRPQGVGALEHRIINYTPFGFGEHYENFSNGSFWWGDGIHINRDVDFEFTFDNEKGILTGRVIPADDAVNYSDIDVTLTYTDAEGNVTYTYVVTDENGVFTDVITNFGYFIVTAKVMLLFIDCEVAEVESKEFTFAHVVKTLTNIFFNTASLTGEIITIYPKPRN